MLLADDATRHRWIDVMTTPSERYSDLFGPVDFTNPAALDGRLDVLFPAGPTLTVASPTMAVLVDAQTGNQLIFLGTLQYDSGQILTTSRLSGIRILTADSRLIAEAVDFTPVSAQVLVNAAYLLPLSFLVSDASTNTSFDIYGTSFADYLIGRVGADTLSGNGGNDTLDGGGGFDIASFQGASAGYAFSRSGGNLVVTDIDTAGGNEGVDTLMSIEAARFTDGLVTLVSGTESRVNSYTTGNQFDASAAALAGGGFVVTWTSEGQDGSGLGVHAQRYDAAGLPQGPEFRVNSFTPNEQFEPSIAALSGGGFVATWTSDGPDGYSNSYGVYAQRYDANGVAQGSEFRVNSYLPSNQEQPAIAGLSNGGFVVTWASLSQDGDTYGVYAQRYNATGLAQGAEFLVNTRTASIQYQPAISALSDGGFLVAWASYGQDGSGYGIYAQRYNSAGVVQGAEFRVNTTTADDQNAPTITALAGGGFVVGWQATLNVYAQRYDAAGLAQGAQFQVNTYTPGGNGGLSIAALSGGDFVATWTSGMQDGDGAGVYARRFSADGVAQGGEFRVNNYTANGQGGSSASGMADGGFVVSWQSLFQDGSGSGIYAQRYDAAGAKVGAITLMGDAAANTLRWTGSEAVWVDGGAGSDALVGGSGNDAMVGGAGDDSYVVDNALDGVIESVGGGVDTVFASVSYALAGGTEVENLILGGSALNATGNEFPNRIVGNALANTLNGGAGNDTLEGGAGNDTISAGDGEDAVVVTHDDGNDVLSGGNGFDILDYSLVNGVVQINQLDRVTTGSAGNDTLLDVFEQVIGTNYGDVLSGGNGGDVLDGMGGNDSFFGNAGDDLMRGGAGDDTFYFSNSDGNDRLLGGDGFDVLDYSSLDGVVQVNQLGGITTGTAGNDTLLDVFEMVIGTAFGDVLSGGNGINSLKGGGGNDTIFGNGGDDYISGGTGNDLITFGPGNDTLDFRNGEGIDTITDFVAGAGSDDTLTLKFYSGLGTATLAGLQGQGRIVQNGANTEITLNGGDMVILANVVAGNLHADDFVFF